VTEGNQRSKKRAILRRVEQEDSTVGCVGGVVATRAREIVTTDMSRRGNEGAQVSIGGVGGDKEHELSIRNASCRKDGDVAVWESWGEAIVTGGPRAHCPGALTPHWPSNRVNLFPLTSETVSHSCRLAPLRLA